MNEQHIPESVAQLDIIKFSPKEGVKLSEMVTELKELSGKKLEIHGKLFENPPYTSDLSPCLDFLFGRCT